MEWINTNAANIFAIVLGLHGVALLIVNLTPTPKDDAILAKIYKGIEFIAGVFGKKIKE